MSWIQQNARVKSAENLLLTEPFNLILFVLVNLYFSVPVILMPVYD